jgi:hypothetical protein
MTKEIPPVDAKELFELRRLILESQQQSLCDADRERLNALVCTPAGASEAACLIDQLSSFADSRQADARLRSNAAMPLSPNVSLCDVRRSRYAHVGFSWSLATVASLFLMTHFVTGWVTWHAARRSAANQMQVELEPQPFATRKGVLSQKEPYLVSTTACVWKSVSGETPAVGKTIAVGEVLNLVEGIAELEFHDDEGHRAQVRIEGPASVFIHPDGRLGLSSGVLVTEVASSGDALFSIDTPFGAVYVAGGASIGIVADGVQKELHVFRGLATLEPSWSPYVRKAISVEPGESVLVLEAGGQFPEFVISQASKSRFTSARSIGFDPLHIGPSYVAEVLASKPDVYWRFEGLDESRPRRIVNQGMLEGVDAIVRGDVRWRQYGENRVAEFGLSGAESAFVSAVQWPSVPLDDYTVELWFKPTCFHHGELLCMTAGEALEDGRYDHGLLLEIGPRHWRTLQHIDANRLRFVHRAPVSADFNDGTTVVSRSQYQSRIWQHVVVRKQGDRLDMIVNGELMGTEYDSQPLAPQMQIVIGQLYPDLNHRPFVGQLDEVALYPRALEDDEVQSHFRTVKPE